MNEEAMEIIDVSEKCMVLPTVDQEDGYSKRRNEWLPHESKGMDVVSYLAYLNKRGTF